MKFEKGHKAFYKKIQIPNEIEILNDCIKLIIKDKHYNKIGECFVDFEDYDRIKDFSWFVNSGYAYNNMKKLLHRFILNNPNGIIDHINRNKLDNRKSNLRICNQSVNLFNANIRCDNVSGCKGIHFNKEKNKWQVKFGNKHKGYFINKTDAIECRKSLEESYFNDI